MFKQELRKPDGRALHLYARTEFEAKEAPSPSKESISLQGAHMRWHPLRGEWVAYAGHRQDRTFLPPKEFNPFAPTIRPDLPTELPQGSYDIAVFENMFPTLSPRAETPPTLVGVATRASLGACEVVVFTRDSESSLARLPLDHIALLLEVWGERYRVLGLRPEISYVLPFENRGVEVGVTLHHPHGQIYAYPFIPPVPLKMLDNEKAYLGTFGQPLLLQFIGREQKDGRRILYEGERAIAFVPACARYPYEVWIAPKLRRSSMDELDAEDRRDIARALKTVLMKYDALWDRPFPYLMTAYQAPTDGAEHPETHFRFEIYPAYRTREKLKYLAGTEIGAGVFANDTFPEETARQLQAVEVDIERA